MPPHSLLTARTYVPSVRALVLTLSLAAVVFVLAGSAGGEASYREWLTFNEVGLNGSKRVLSRHNIFPEEASYSPRRRQLAYVPYYADGVRSNRLWVADLDSSEDRLVYEAPAWITGVAWSPDGQTIAFVSGDGIWLISPNGINLRRVGEWGAFLAWSPDSSQIAYMVLTTGGRWLIRIRSLASGSARDLVRGQNFQWSPDGKRIAFENFGGGSCKSQIRVITVQDGRSKAIGCGHSPSWSPDGKRVALGRYATHAPYTPSLWVVSTRAGRPRRLANSATGAVWSPDSRWIAFRRAARNCASKLGVVRADGGRPRVLAAHTRIVGPLAWSSNGRKVVYEAQLCSDQ